MVLIVSGADRFPFETVYVTVSPALAMGAFPLLYVFPSFENVTSLPLQEKHSFAVSAEPGLK